MSKLLSKKFLLVCFSTATFMLPNNKPVAAPKPSSKNSSLKTSLVSPAQKAQKAHLLISLSKRRVYVYSDNKVKTSYPIAIGKTGWKTPIGSFKVIVMKRDPYWRHPFTKKVVPPGKDNPLGKRYIGFLTGSRMDIGLHGTNEDNLIGQAVSHGCVRMHNKDAIALFDQVSVGTPVIVQP